MEWIAIALAVILLVIALVHLGWALGSNWPADDEQTLSNMVVGTPGATVMPPKALTFFVALAITVAAVWPLLWTAIIAYPHWFPQTLIWLGMWCLTLIFLFRGFGGYLPMASNTVEPFRRLNRVLYSPLCIVLGAGFLTLVLNP